MSVFQIMLSIVSGIAVIVFIINRVLYFMRLKELDELKGCPFKYKPLSESGIAFKLCDGAVLHCDCSFGIRSDGYYGINEISILGINGSQCGIRNLKIGQSVFPIISAYDKFFEWIKQQPFNVEIDREFADQWLKMKKNLNNLRYLETEEKKKQK